MSCCGIVAFVGNADPLIFSDKYLYAVAQAIPAASSIFVAEGERPAGFAELKAAWEQGEISARRPALASPYDMQSMALELS
ncbi:hypothetical protein SDC9_186205 [bioreactor metagenome]|uniref:Uncharacterized protein n=1 Tax=bioreactor metagenome TaxID=1076179 RepID=A0A645HIW2_9ZZZZ|nr:hypothetical protein [Candidatus Pelethousia sp.]